MILRTYNYWSVVIKLLCMVYSLFCELIINVLAWLCNWKKEVVNVSRTTLLEPLVTSSILMVTGQLNDLRAKVFSRHFLCCTHATKGIEDAHTKAIRNFDARLVCRRKADFNFFWVKMKPSQWPASKERMVGWAAERERKKRRGEKARDAVQWANNYFFKKV